MNGGIDFEEKIILLFLFASILATTGIASAAAIGVTAAICLASEDYE